MVLVNIKLTENRLVFPKKIQITAMYCTKPQAFLGELTFCWEVPNTLFSVLRRLKETRPQPILTHSNSHAAPFSKTKEAGASGWVCPDCDPYRAVLVLCSFAALATGGWTGGHLTLSGIITFSLLRIWKWDSSLFIARQSPEGHTLLGSEGWLFARGSRTSQAA